MADPMTIVLLVMLALAAGASGAEERPSIGGPAPLPTVHDLSGNSRPRNANVLNIPGSPST